MQVVRNLNLFFHYYLRTSETSVKYTKKQEAGMNEMQKTHKYVWFLHFYLHICI